MKPHSPSFSYCAVGLRRGRWPKGQHVPPLTPMLGLKESSAIA